MRTLIEFLILVAFSVLITAIGVDKCEFTITKLPPQPVTIIQEHPTQDILDPLALESSTLVYYAPVGD